MGLLEDINLLCRKDEYISSAAVLAKSMAFVCVGDGNCVSWLQRCAVFGIECDTWP